MKKYFMLLFMFLAHTSTYAQAPVSTYVLRPNVPINFKGATGATTTIFYNATGVAAGATGFVPTDIIFVGNTIAGTVGFPTTPVFSMGTVAPYEDLIAVAVTPIIASGNSVSYSIGSFQNAAYGRSPVIPANATGATVVVKLITPDATATTNTQNIYLQGYFLTP